LLQFPKNVELVCALPLAGGWRRNVEVLSIQALG
jgi:hypothetical protein